MGTCGIYRCIVSVALEAVARVGTMAAASNPLRCRAELKMQFLSERDASIVSTSLNVDKELQEGAGKVTRSITADGSSLVLVIEAADERTLRLCLSGFMEFAATAVATLDEFV